MKWERWRWEFPRMMVQGEGEGGKWGTNSQRQSVYVCEHDLWDEIWAELWLVKTRVREFVHASQEGRSQAGWERMKREDERPFPPPRVEAKPVSRLSATSCLHVEACAHETASGHWEMNTISTICLGKSKSKNAACPDNKHVSNRVTAKSPSYRKNGLKTTTWKTIPFLYVTNASNLCE